MFVLNKGKQMLETNKVSDDYQKPFFNMRHELSISLDGLILCGDRIVIPQACQELIIKYFTMHQLIFCDDLCSTLTHQDNICCHLRSICKSHTSTVNGKKLRIKNVG